MSIGLRQLCHLRPALYSALPALGRFPERRTRPLSLLLTNCSQCWALQASQHRLLATKKTKAKGKGQPHTRVNINAALVDDIIDLNELREEMLQIIEKLQDDYGKNLSIRTSPGALDHITVTIQDGKFPLNQLAQISLKSPQLILVNMASFPEMDGFDILNPFDYKRYSRFTLQCILGSALRYLNNVATEAATKAIRESGMNLNPEVDGSLIRVPIPKVTRDHRESLGKLAKQLTNKAKESLRKVRGNAITSVKKSKDFVSEDTIRLIEKQIQQMADDMATDMDKQLAAKTKELLG